MTLSAVVNKAIAAAEADGNMLVEVSSGWTKVREVALMRDPMGQVTRAKLHNCTGLRA